jgi:hypothetical protein
MGAVDASKKLDEADVAKLDALASHGGKQKRYIAAIILISNESYSPLWLGSSHLPGVTIYLFIRMRDCY